MRLSQISTLRIDAMIYSTGVSKVSSVPLSKLYEHATSVAMEENGETQCECQNIIENPYNLEYTRPVVLTLAYMMTRSSL